MLQYYRAGELSKDEMNNLLNSTNQDFRPTGELIKKVSEDCNVTKIVYTGNYTPYGFIRDCKDHYIEALYSSYRWISKDLRTIRDDVEDK